MVERERRRIAGGVAAMGFAARAVVARFVAARILAAIAWAAALLVTTPARADSELLGPLRIRDMTPFNLLRLDMLPAHAVDAGPGSWAIEADLSFSNTFVMSDNVRNYLEARGGGRRALTQADADAILAMGHDAYYVDGEFGLLEVTFHYRVARRTSLYTTLSAYDFSGGFMDGPIEGFHNTFGLGDEGRNFVERDRFQTVLSLRGASETFLEAPIDGGLGDPVVGVRQAVPLGASRWNLVFSAEVKFAWRGERLLLSTGTDDYGLQAALQGKFRRQAVYVMGSFVRTDGRVLGIELAPRVVPTGIAAYELGLTEHLNFIGQLYASQSTVRDSTIPEISANKYQASLGLRSHRGRLIYGFAVTENVENFDNTPDVGLSFTLVWAALRR